MIHMYKYASLFLLCIGTYIDSYKLWNNCNFGAEYSSSEFSRMSDKELYNNVVQHQVINIKNIYIDPIELEEISYIFGKYGYVTKNFPVINNTNHVTCLINEYGKKVPGSSWHIDLAFLNITTTMTILYGINTTKDSDTLFISTYDIYKNLQDNIKTEINNLYIKHTSESKTKHSIKPLIYSHPILNKKCLYVEDIKRMDNIVNYTKQMSNRLLNYLSGIIFNNNNICNYKWSNNDLLIFDNRCLIHKASAKQNIKYRKLYRIFMYS